MPNIDEKERHEMALDLLSEGKWAEALVILLDLSKTSEYYRNSHNIYYCIGQCYRYTNRFSLAISSLEKCLELIEGEENIDPETAGSAYLAMGIACQQNYEDERAINSFLLGIDKNPQNATLYNSLGLTFKFMENYDEAFRAYSAAHDILVTRALDSMGIAPVSKNTDERLDQITELLQSGKLRPVLASNIDFSFVCNNIGQVQILMGNPKGAVLALLASIKHIPEGEVYDIPKETLTSLLDDIDWP